jgi:hypothetical protein
LKVQDGRAASRERRLGCLDRGERSVDLREDRRGRVGRKRGFPRVTPRLLDVGQATQGVLQERRAPREGAQPLARLKLSLSPELLLKLDHVERRMATQDRLGGRQLDIHLAARFVQMPLDRLDLGRHRQRCGQIPQHVGHLRGSRRDFRHRNRIRGWRRGSGTGRTGQSGRRRRWRRRARRLDEAALNEQRERRKRKPEERGPCAHSLMGFRRVPTTTRQAPSPISRRAPS